MQVWKTTALVDAKDDFNEKFADSNMFASRVSLDFDTLSLRIEASNLVIERTHCVGGVFLLGPQKERVLSPAANTFVG